jgi:hypothetical protein
MPIYRITCHIDHGLTTLVWSASLPRRISPARISPKSYFDPVISTPIKFPVTFPSFKRVLASNA